MITITERAQERIRDVLYDLGKPDSAIRIYIHGGGCSGFQYGFMIEHEIQPDDFKFEVAPFNVVVDGISMQYLEGSRVDYREDLMSSNFVVDNPNAVGHCGCGTSFSV